MRKKDILTRALGGALVLALLLGSVWAISLGRRAQPENPIDDEPRQLMAETLGGGETPEEEQEENNEEPPPDQQDQPDEQEDEEEPPEEQPEPEQTSNQEPAQDPIVTPPANNPSGNQSGGNATGGEGTTDDPNAPGGGTGGEGESGGNTPAENPDAPETVIVTDLNSGIISQADNPTGRLDFYAYGEGADDLSVEVYVRKDTERRQTRLTTLNGKDYGLTMELGQTYVFTLYLKQPGQATKYVTRTVTYQAKRADADNPTVGDYPPRIITNMDEIPEGSEIQGENYTLIVSVKTTDGTNRTVRADRVKVTLNGVEVPKDTGDESPEYNLFFAKPNVGDYKEYKIEIVAWYDNNSTYWSKTLVYHAAAEGDVVGNARVVLDATTVGVGI
ncbi:MAG: hypothetical protein IJ072_03400, partial [Oscillospiraceae bacterium]|nr:hypothetical protein [Oscillospiraceae bacterium]